MNVKKLHMSLKISNFMIINNTVICFNSMHNLYANFVKILEICKKFSYGLVNDPWKYSSSWCCPSLL